VASLQQCEQENYRVIVLARDRTEILVVARARGVQLPSIDIPQWQRTAESLCAAVKNEFGCEAVCLVTLQDMLGSGSWENQHYQIMECSRHAGTCNNKGFWAPIRSLSRQSFDNGEEYAAIEQFSTKLSLSSANPSLPFARPEWFRELRDWISEKIRPLGIRLTGVVQQFNACPTFSLIRFETSGPAVWFKAAGEPNQREFDITLKLTELLPDYLPKIISTRPDWNGWLSFEVEGTNLADTREISAWEKTAATLAVLQIDSVSSVNEIAASGARDLSGAALSDLLSPFFNVMAQLMKQQSKIPPMALSKLELQSLEEIVRDSLAQLQDLSVPNTIGHLDLNPGNIIVSPFGYTFLDWAEAYIGNPIFSFQYLLEHFRQSASADPHSETRLTATYVEPWHSRIPAAALNEALQLSPLLAAFAYAVASCAWRDQETFLNDSRTAGYLRSLTRRMNREAKHLCERRLLCLC